MRLVRTTICLPLVFGSIMLGLSGCSSKAVQSGGDSQPSQQGAAKGSDEGGVSRNIPDTSFSGRDGSGGLRGLDKNPSEERLGSNTLTAKADPGSAMRQMEDISAEQIASAAAGLRDVFFAYDSFAVSEEGRQALGRDAEWIKSNPGARLKVEGHCDERGTQAYNLVLGEKRAKAVRNYLVELGVAPKQLSVVSYGKERPVCTEHAESCYSQNRRGHLVVKAGK
jgi:peptidoglycan-associated lipoprotein